MQGEDVNLAEAMSDLKHVLTPIKQALSHVTREVRPADTAFTHLCKVIRKLQTELARVGVLHTEGLKRMTEAEHKLLDYEGKPMLFSQRQRLRELEELRGQYEAACWDRTTLMKRRDELESENALLRAARNITVDHAHLDNFARAWLTELIECLEALPKQWREQAASVNDPKSPSLLVECAEQLEQALDLELPK